MNKRILVVDEYELVHTALAGLLSDSDDYVLLPHSRPVKSAMRQIAAQAPDLIIVDPDQEDARALLPSIRESHPELRILVLSRNENPDDVQLALQQGVDGYIPKHTSRRDMKAAIDAVFAGDIYVHPSVSSAILRNRRGLPRGEPMLTSRQEETLRMIAEGMTVKQIAATLGLSAKTVESHRVTLMNRLGIHHVPGLVHFAIRHGYVKLAGNVRTGTRITRDVPLAHAQGE